MRHPDPDCATCFVFDHFDDARQFCEAKVRLFPNLRGAVYDAEGLVHPPLLVVIGTDQQQNVKVGSAWVRIRRIIAAVLFLAAPLLVWIDVRRENVLILPTFLALNCILTGVRLLLWDAGQNRKEEGRRKRLEVHLRKEQRGA